MARQIVCCGFGVWANSSTRNLASMGAVIMAMRMRNPTTMAAEQTIQQQIRLACSKGPTRLWRNNTGALRDANGQLIRFGLCEGSADLIGYTTVEITPEMVGQRVAVFAAVEVKSRTGRPTPQQTAFLAHIEAAGGRAGIARSIADAQLILRGAG